MALVRIPSQTIAFDAVDLLPRIEKGRLDLNPSYQRSSAWSLEQRSALVRSWIVGLPIPSVVINDRVKAGTPLVSGKPSAAVVDGKQRIETALLWVQGGFAVPASWFEDADLGATASGGSVTYADLSAIGQRMPMPLPVVETYVRTEREEAELFLLLNQGGVSQTAADLDRARRVVAGADVTARLDGTK